MDLERELRALPIEWPATPQLRPVLARRRRRWPLAAAIALAAVAAAFAVPQSRGAILRFFDIGADKIQFVDTLPPAQQRALNAGLGAPTTLVNAHRLVPTLLLPPLDSTFALRASGTAHALVASRLLLLARQKKYTGKPATAMSRPIVERRGS